MARLTGKLTAKALGWNKDRIQAAIAADKAQPTPTGRIKLGRFVGIVVALRQTVSDETGEIQTGLKGQFRGVSTLGTDTGKEVDAKTNPPLTVTAGVCYLPSGIQEVAETALSDAKQKGGANASAQFGVDLFAIPAENAAGYSFDADNLFEPTEADPLDTLLAMASDGGSPAQEPAPAKGKQKEKEDA